MSFNNNNNNSNNNNNPPHSASSWTYGGYTPWAPPPSAPQPSPVWGQTPATSWGAATPAATWAAPSPSGSWGPPQTPAAYSPWAPPQQQPQQGGTWYTPHMPKQPLPSPTFETTSGQPITAGWFGGKDVSGGNAGHTGYPEGTWGQRSQPTTPNKRSNSIKRPASRHEQSAKATHLQRSTSWGQAQSAAHGFGGQNGGGYSLGSPYASNVPPYARGDIFDERNLAKRPLDWRQDYKPSFTSYIPGLGKSKSEVADWVDPVRRSFHPLLLYTQQNPPVYCNLIETPFHTSSIEFLNLSRPHNDIDFAQLACQPSAPFLRLYHPRLPWYIDIRQVHPNGITVLDVLSQMHAQLHTPIHGRHFYNEDLSDIERTEITRAFQNRCRTDPALISRGVLQLDFLGKRVVFEGIVRGPRGLWEIKLSKEM
ncbi:hypothetical protein CPB83DRAFT_139071 [Crepidotus variabilis]|uniref:DUF6699 domain-containing protein n=1 Tax=Crepidotus variabilis TaxID=179855 RepID=A0A9P6JIC6_9AGAR|nr:hypothetical protein CPB83DRAFT_139071 [Crepidotus variabilis]